MPTKNKGTEPGGTPVLPGQLSFHAPPGELEELEEGATTARAVARETPVKTILRILLAYLMDELEEREQLVDPNADPLPERSVRIAAAIGAINAHLRRIR